MSIHLRDVKLDRLVGFVSLLSAEGEAKYEILKTKAECQGTLSPEAVGKRLAKGTFYRYLLACQEFGLVEKMGSGMYRVTESGIMLVSAMRKDGPSSEQVVEIVRKGFVGSQMVKESFVSLFTCRVDKPLCEGEPIAYIPSRTRTGVSDYQVYKWCSNSTIFLNKSETKALLWGLRFLAMELGLVDELVVPRSTVVSPERTLMIYPLLPHAGRLNPYELHQMVLDVLIKITDMTSGRQDSMTCLVAIPDILYLLCPLLRHPVSLARDELASWVEANEHWVRAEKVARFVRDYSYVERGLHKQFGKTSERIFIKVHDYHISHIVFRYPSLVSELRAIKEVYRD